MPETTPEPPPSTLELIDRAITAAKQAAHACRHPLAREHFEYTLALLHESWIAEDGQEGRPAGEVIANVADALSIFAAVFQLTSNRPRA